VTTVLQRIDLADRVAVERARTLTVHGFRDDTLVRRALERLAAEVGAAPAWRARIWKKIPVAAGLGGGSSDAATALRLANGLLAEPLPTERLLRLAAELGSDVPFFLTDGPQLGQGDGSELARLELPQDYWIVLLQPSGEAKPSTAAVYGAFDERLAAAGYEERRGKLLDAVAAVRRPRDLAAFPANDLASSPLSAELVRLGAFRADVTGAGPVVYGLFHHRGEARAAARALKGRGRLWITVPAWYG
jgi:4-diphosphocytidyl-2-C-methyl-D-erythritol kinase